jgi:putative transposase
VLKGHVEVVLKRVLKEVADKYGFSIDHMEIGKDDHIHLLVSAPPKLSVTNIVRWLKGISAWTLFKECPELQSSYWKKQDRHLWSPSYYVESIGTTNESAVAKYVDDQKKKEVNLNDSKGD